MVPASLAANCLPLTLSFRILPTSSAFTKAVESLADKSSKVWAQLHTSSALHPFDQTPTSIRTICRCATWRWWVHSQHQWAPLKGVRGIYAYNRLYILHISLNMYNMTLYIHKAFKSCTYILYTYLHHMISSCIYISCAYMCMLYDVIYMPIISWHMMYYMDCVRISSWLWSMAWAMWEGVACDVYKCI